MNSPLLQSLFDEQERRPLSVSELNAQVRAELERRFAQVWVEGEIVNFAAVKSGHWYFTLHDGSSQIRAACFKNSNWKIRFKPEDGLSVRVRGRLSLYEPRGEYQLIVESLEPVGEGALKIAYEQIRAKLDAEGLFADELKRPMPLLPRRVGVVTSPNGAAYFDILNVISRRTRSVSVVLVPTRVQGENAGEEIREAILFANTFNKSAGAKEKIDVLIVGRGGGSSEDLWAFNEERLARAIRDSVIPVISAVGHEVDFTIADLVADLRAATPSAAAELVASRETDLDAFIQSRTDRLHQTVDRKILAYRNDLQSLAMSPVFADLSYKIGRRQSEIDDLGLRTRSGFLEILRTFRNKLEGTISQLSPLGLASKMGENKTRLALLENRQTSAARNMLREKDENLRLGMASLDALSPLSVLKRGFSITQDQAGHILRDSAQTKAGSKLNIRLARGEVKAEVLSTDEN